MQTRFFKKISLFILTIFLSLVTFSQELPYLNCSERIYLDTIALKKEIQDRIDNPNDISYRFLNDPKFKLEDANGYLTIYKILIYPDTLENKIKYRLIEDDILLYFPGNLGLFSWDKEWKRLRYIEKSRTQNFVLALLFSTSDEYKDRVACRYSLSLFPEDEHHYKILCFKKDDSDDLFCFDNERNLFDSLESLLNVYFGSIQGYIDAYKNRTEWKGKQREVFNKLMNKNKTTS